MGTVQTPMLLRAPIFFLRYVYGVNVLPSTLGVFDRIDDVSSLVPNLIGGQTNFNNS